VVRKCVKYELEELIEDFNIEVKYDNIFLYVDSEVEQEIDEFLKDNSKHFLRILYYIFRGQWSEHHYGQEPYETTAMKFKGDKNLLSSD